MCSSPLDGGRPDEFPDLVGEPVRVVRSERGPGAPFGERFDTDSGQAGDGAGARGAVVANEPPSVDSPKSSLDNHFPFSVDEERVRLIRAVARVIQDEHPVALL